MIPWFVKVGKRALLVCVVLAVTGIAVVQILRKVLQTQSVDVDMSLEFPIMFGLMLGISGLILVFVFEAIGSAWQSLRGRKPAESSTTEVAP